MHSEVKVENTKVVVLVENVEEKCEFVEAKVGNSFEVEATAGSSLWSEAEGRMTYNRLNVSGAMDVRNLKAEIAECILKEVEGMVESNWKVVVVMVENN